MVVAFGMVLQCSCLLCLLCSQTCLESLLTRCISVHTLKQTWSRSLRRCLHRSKFRLFANRARMTAKTGSGLFCLSCFVHVLVCLVCLLVCLCCCGWIVVLLPIVFLCCRFLFWCCVVVTHCCLFSLECFHVACGRHANGHMLEHNTQTGHAVVCGLDDLSFWCYKCESYLHHTTMDPILRAYVVIHKLKFGAAPTMTVCLSLLFVFSCVFLPVWFQFRFRFWLCCLLFCCLSVCLFHWCLLGV